MKYNYTQQHINDIEKRRIVESETEKLKAQLVALKIIKKFVMNIETVINGDDVVERWEARSFREGGLGMGITLEDALRDWFGRNLAPKQLCDNCAGFLHVRLERRMSKGVCPICGGGRVRQVHYSTNSLDGEEVFFD